MGQPLHDHVGALRFGGEQGAYHRTPFRRHHPARLRCPAQVVAGRPRTTQHTRLRTAKFAIHAKWQQHSFSDSARTNSKTRRGVITCSKRRPSSGTRRSGSGDGICAVGQSSIHPEHDYCHYTLAPKLDDGHAACGWRFATARRSATGPAFRVVQ